MPLKAFSCLSANEMVMGEGSWDVSADTRINYSNDALTKTVSLFNNYLDGRFGVTLKKGSNPLAETVSTSFSTVRMEYLPPSLLITVLPE